jgi:hypothetical protein
MSRLTLFLLACSPSLCFADTLQFELGSGGAFASYAQVQVSNQQGQLVYRGTSDGYGRISTSLPAGDYRVSITTRAGVKSSGVHLSDTNVLLRITLPPS